MALSLVGTLSSCMHVPTGGTITPSASSGQGKVVVSDVVQPFTTRAHADTLELGASSFYAALEASSSGIVTAANRCRPELLDRLTSFAKSFFAVERSAAFIVTTDVKAGGVQIHDDLPLLVIRGGDAAGGGRTCEVTGPAVSASSSRITPYFRVDPTLEIQLSFDLKVVEDANIGTVEAVLDHAQQVIGLAGGDAVVVGKLGSDLAAGLARSSRHCHRRFAEGHVQGPDQRQPEAHGADRRGTGRWRPLRPHALFGSWSVAGWRSRRCKGGRRSPLPSFGGWRGRTRRARSLAGECRHDLELPTGHRRATWPQLRQGA